MLGCGNNVTGQPTAFDIAYPSHLTLITHGIHCMSPGINDVVTGSDNLVIGSTDTVVGSNNTLSHAYHSAGPNVSRAWKNVVTGDNSAQHT